MENNNVDNIENGNEAKEEITHAEKNIADIKREIAALKEDIKNDLKKKEDAVDEIEENTSEVSQQEVPIEQEVSNKENETEEVQVIETQREETVHEEAQESENHSEDIVHEEAQESEIQSEDVQDKESLSDEVQKEEIQPEVTKQDEELTESIHSNEVIRIEDLPDLDPAKVGMMDDFDVDDIKLEEIDLEQIKKELEEQKNKQNSIEDELDMLEKNILMQSDIFETEANLGAMLQDDDLMSGIKKDVTDILIETGRIPTSSELYGYGAQLEATKVQIPFKGEEDKISHRVEEGTADISVNQEKENSSIMENSMSNSGENIIENKSKKKTYNKAMSKVLVAVTCVFVCLIVHIVFYVMIDSKTKLNNEYNERSLLLEETVIRGKIYSSENKILAQTIREGDGWIRHYPYGSLFAHTVGRYDRGKTGIELSYDFTLVTSKDSTMDKILNDIKNEKSIGNGIKTTLNYRLQKIASDALGTKKGAVVALEPTTGKVLAMVSKPSYDPNYIDDNWSVLSNADNSKKSLVNRATVGLYPPGSTFKVVTALSYLRSKDITDFVYTCNGSEIFNGYKIECHDNKKHKKQNMTEAFSESCNGAFGTIGLEVGKDKLYDTASDLLFNEKIKYEQGYAISKMELSSKDDDTMLAQTAIGQGETQITPLHNALIASAVANKGIMMKPYLVDQILDGSGDTIDVTTARKLSKVMTEEESALLTNLMRAVVTDGTAKSLKNLDYAVAGKTGSAEYGEAGDSHAWFIGFAPAENPTIAISVLVEDGGTGASTAVPIAEKVFNAYLNYYK